MENADTFTIELCAAGRPVPFRFLPGQFNMIYVFGAGEVAISISGDPRITNSCMHTIRAVGGVTQLLRGLKAGAQVGVRGPFGNCWPTVVAREKDLLIVAGGVGIAALRPVICEALARRQEFRRVAIVYGSRNPESLIYRGDLTEWGKNLELICEVTVDAGEPGWDGHVGVIPPLLRRLPLDWNETVAMICGPELMMRFVIEELLSLGVLETGIHLSMERNMKCGTGFCGHCQYGPKFICKDGPVFRFDRIRDLFFLREL
jgi:NAD(P)H-flavin reductase